MTEDLTDKRVIELTNNYINAHLKLNLFSPEWLKLNLTKLVSILPQTWTNCANIGTEDLVYNFKVLGIFINNQIEYDVVIHMLLRSKILIKSKDNPYLMKVSPEYKL